MYAYIIYAYIYMCVYIHMHIYICIYTHTKLKYSSHNCLIGGKTPPGCDSEIKYLMSLTSLQELSFNNEKEIYA